MLERISARYETTAAQVQVVETRFRGAPHAGARQHRAAQALRGGGVAAGADRQEHLPGRIAHGELTALLERTEDPLKRERIQNPLHDVAMRVQDLQAMQAVHQQFFVGIEMTRQNNQRLAQSVERTVSMATKRGHRRPSHPGCAGAGRSECWTPRSRRRSSG